MTNPDFRALCAELADTLECVLDSPDPHCLALIARARAALAQPEPVAPTPSLKEPTPIETVCYYDDPENLPYFVGN